MMKSWKQTDLGNPFSSYYREIDQDSYLRQNPEYEPIRSMQKVKVESRDTVRDRYSKASRSAMKTLGVTQPVKPYHSFTAQPIPYYSNGEETRGRPTTATVKSSSFRKSHMTPQQKRFVISELNRRVNHINGMK